jgi:hypothetical protein
MVSEGVVLLKDGIIWYQERWMMEILMADLFMIDVSVVICDMLDHLQQSLQN